MISTHSNIKAIEKRFISKILGSLSILFLFLYTISKHVQVVSDLLKNYQLIYLFSSITSLISFILLNNAKFNFKKVVHLISLFFILNCLILGVSINYISLVSYTFIIPAALMIQLITRKKNVIILSLLLMFFFISISYLLNISSNFEKKSTIIIYSLSVLTVLINTYFSLIIIKFSRDLVSDYNANKTLQVVQDPKLTLLFEEIINYIVKEKGYGNADINKRKLATELKTNQTYISKSLSVIGNITFNTLVNQNRIKYITEEIANNSHKKFTIEHIYKKAGFNQQSTFNRVFKEFTGKTPSEYIENQDCKI